MLRPSFVMRALLAAGLGCAAFALAAGPAEAEPTSIKLVRRMLPPLDSLRAHPLADARGRIPFLVELPRGVSAESLGLREVAPGFASGRYLPEDLLAFGDAFPDLAVSVTPGSKPQLEKARIRTNVPVYQKQLPEGVGTGKGIVVGGVDTGIDLTHPTFRFEDGRTRVAWLLTWGEPTGNHPELEARFGCNDPDQVPCAIFDADEIDAMLESGALPEDVHDFAGHGTHVMSIAAGNGRTGSAKAATRVGIAPEATIVFASPSINGGFADDEVLRGVDFVFERAEAMGMPAVVNLSLGGDYGPHDGTSMLEAGTAAFVGDDKPGRVIVTAAGNSGALYQIGDTEPLGIHTEVHVEEHAPAKVPIIIPQADGGDVYIWITFRPGDDVSVGLEGPGGETWIGLTPPGDEAGYSDGDNTTAAVINNLVNEHSSLTADTNGAVVAFNGDWPADSQFALVLEGSGDAQMWMVPNGKAREGYFVQATKQGTVNQPGSHPRLLAVGCTINRLDWTALDAGPLMLGGLDGQSVPPEDSACYFSGAGPTPLGVPKPEISAPGAFVAGAMSVDADPRENASSMFNEQGCPDNTFCYVVDQKYAIASGTSMSAPVVSGTAALLLEQAPSLTQALATEVLVASARRPLGDVPLGSQLGAGAVDMKHALEVLAAESPSSRRPDVAQSFYFLSNERLRPDPTWNATGTIQLRREDGTIASGLDGSLLSVEVTGGLLTQAPTKLSHGTFKFTVAARKASAGSVVSVRVLYDGRQIGETAQLPVAIDAWAGDVPTPTGGLGCFVASPGSSPAQRDGRHVWAGVLGLFGLLVAQRRRRAR